MKKTNLDHCPEIAKGTPRLLKNYIEATRNGNENRIINASEILKEYIMGKIEAAISELYTNDLCLLQQEMYEVTVCGRLAMYLQKQFQKFKNYNVDIEYYILTAPQEDVTNLRTERIRCDILLHSRNYYERRVDNLVAIEVKLEKSKDDGISDVRRLLQFVTTETSETPPTAVHSTLIALFLRMGVGGYSKVLCTNQGFVRMNDEIPNNTDPNHERD